MPAGGATGAGFDPTGHGRGRVLSAWYFAYFAFIGAFLPYFALYLDDAGLTPAEIGIVMAVGQVMRLAAPLAWGWLSDRDGRRVPVLRISALASALAFSVYFLPLQFAGFLLASILLHFFWSGALPLAEALTFAHLRDRPEAYGRIRLWGSVGFIVAVLSIGWLLDHAPISALLWASAAVLWALVIVTLRLSEVSSAVGRPATDSLASSGLDGRALALLAAGFFMAAAHGPLYVFFSIYLVDNGYSTTLAGGLWSLGVIAEILVFLAMPRLGRRFSLRGLLLFAFALAVIRFLMIGWGVGTLAILILAQLMHAATFGIHHAVSVAAFHHWFPPSRQGKVKALYGATSFGAGGIAGAVMAGQCWSDPGPAATFTLAALLAAAGAAVSLLGIPAGERLHRGPTPVT